MTGFFRPAVWLAGELIMIGHSVSARARSMPQPVFHKMYNSSLHVICTCSRIPRVSTVVLSPELAPLHRALFPITVLHV